MKPPYFFFFSFLLTFCGMQYTCAQTWQSAKVFYNAQNRLQYSEDQEKNKIPDFSYAGYKRGEDSIPFIPVVKTIGPVAGDNTTYLQNVIDSMALLPVQANGFRGALLLKPGKYNVWGTIKVNVTGLVVRGSGNGTDTTSSTIIFARGNTPAQRPVIVAGGGSNTMWKDSVAGTRTMITSAFVAVGDRKFTVQSSAAYAVGDNIIIYHPCSDAWLLAVDSGATNGSNPWTLNEQPIVFNRRITSINGNEITIDAPIFNHLNRSLSQSFIYKYSRSGIRTKIGVENLRVDIETLGGTDENHAWDAIQMGQIEDSWVKNCVMLHFGLSGIQTFTATRITIENCIATDPVSLIEGGKRYNFNCYAASQLILFKNCTAIRGRHHYVSNGHSYTSGIVFYNCRSENIYSSSEGHRRWSQGLLYDNVTEYSPLTSGTVLGLYNRGDYGTGHGWASVHSVAWNYNAGSRTIIIQKPPTGQNYAIGCFGSQITGTKPPAPFSQPPGFIEGSNTANLNPKSLYIAQLQERLSPASQNEGYLRKTISPPGIELMQSYPNPFNPGTRISYKLTENARVSVKIFDSLGRQIETFAEKSMQRGEHSFNWSANGLPSGLYYCRISTENSSRTIKLLLMR